MAHIEYNTYPLIMYALRIDLSNPKLHIVVTDDKHIDRHTQKFLRQSTLQFANEYNTNIAINASFFIPSLNMYFSNSVRSRGVHISNGKILNPPTKNLGALCFKKNNLAEILDYQNNDMQYKMAISGLKVILKNGKQVITNLHPIEDSRNCVGVSQDGKTLFILLVLGENHRESRGLKYDDTAIIMKMIGAWNAIHLDGGGSASLVVKDVDKFRVIAPKKHIFGYRKVATNIGFIIGK